METSNNRGKNTSMKLSKSVIQLFGVSDEWKHCLCAENGCWIIVAYSSWKWNNYEKKHNCPVFMFSFNFLTFWTLINIIQSQFSPMSYSLCISHPNLTLQTHKGHVALQGAHASSRYNKCVSKELTRLQTKHYKTEAIWPEFLHYKFLCCFSLLYVCPTMKTRTTNPQTYRPLHSCREVERDGYMSCSWNKTHISKPCLY